MFGEILFLAVLIGFSAFFSGSETALFSISEITIRRLVKERRRGAKTLHAIRSKPNMLLATILIGNNIVNISAASIATVISIRIFGDIGAGVAVGALTILILAFGEIFPKSLAYNHAETIALLVAKPLKFLMIILWPAAKFFSLMNEKLSKPMKDRNIITEEDVKIALTMGEESGSIKSYEKTMIHNVFEFSDTTASHVMTSHDDVIYISSDTIVKDAIQIMGKEGLSRLPVYEGEKIIGLVYIKDLIKHIGKDTIHESVKKDLKPVIFVPEYKKLGSLIKELRKKHTSMAIVVDERAMVQGIVTIEDLVEEIMGEMYDETDEDETGIGKAEKNSFIVDGKTKLIDLRKHTGIKLTEKDINTVSGFIMDYLERMPLQGETLKAKGTTLTVLKATDKEILKVKIEKK